LGQVEFLKVQKVECASEQYSGTPLVWQLATGHWSLVVGHWLGNISPRTPQIRKLAFSRLVISHLSLLITMTHGRWAVANRLDVRVKRSSEPLNRSTVRPPAHPATSAEKIRLEDDHFARPGIIEEFPTYLGDVLEGYGDVEWARRVVVETKAGFQSRHRSSESTSQIDFGGYLVARLTNDHSHRPADVDAKYR
jgi:hypothetical protein